MKIFQIVLYILIALFGVLLVSGVVIVSINLSRPTDCPAKIWELDIAWVIVFGLFIVWCGLKIYDISRFTDNVTELKDHPARKSSDLSWSVDVPSTYDAVALMTGNVQASQPVQLHGISITQVVLMLLGAVPWFWTMVVTAPGNLRPWSCAQDYDSALSGYAYASFLFTTLVISGSGAYFCIALSTLN